MARRFDVRDLPRSTLALYAGGVMLGLAGVVSVLIWYTGTLEPTPEQVVATQVPSSPTASAAASPDAKPSPAAGQTPDAKPTGAAATRVAVANTGGLGAVIRAEPSTEARVVAGAPDGTVLEVVGPDVQADGRTWRNVRDPQGNRGFIAGELVRPAS